MLGTLTTREQIANGAHYQSSLLNSKEDEVKYEAWDTYISKGGDLKRVRRLSEVWSYRIMGEISSFFVHGQELHDDPIVDSLSSVIELWVFHDAEGLLPRLKHFHAIKEVEGTRAELRRAYMDAYQAANSIDLWKYANVNLLRHTMFEVDRDTGHRQSQKRAVPDSGKPWYPASNHQRIH